MFFPRLRSRAKWVFVLLILVFAGGFVFLGVGSGGLDLGQLLRDAFGNKGSSGGSVGKAQEEVAKHPRQAAAYRNLATVLEQKGRNDEAISALQGYARLRPKDAAELEHLARLELNQAETFLNQARLVYAQQLEATAGSTFGPSQSSKFGQALGQDPISSALSTKFSTELQAATTKYQAASTQAIATFKQVVKLQPKNLEAVLALAQAAETYNDPKTAIAAYKQAITLTDDTTTRARVRERIKALEQASKSSSGG